MSKKLKDMVSITDIIKFVALIFGLIGGTITMGDRLWASKEEVSDMKTDIKLTAQDVKWIKKVFEDAIQDKK